MPSISIVIIRIIRSPVRPYEWFVSAICIMNCLMAFMIRILLICTIIGICYICLIVWIILICPVVQLFFCVRFSRDFSHIFSFLNRKRSRTLLCARSRLPGIRFTRTKTKPIKENSFSVRFCGVKHRNSRGTTTVNTQLLSQSHNEHLIGMDSFEGLRFCSTIVRASPAQRIRTLILRMTRGCEELAD